MWCVRAPSACSLVSCSVCSLLSLARARAGGDIAVGAAGEAGRGPPLAAAQVPFAARKQVTLRYMTCPRVLGLRSAVLT
eukprot:1811811-Rhodomonas_salina.4